MGSVDCWKKIGGWDGLKESRLSFDETKVTVTCLKDIDPVSLINFTLKRLRPGDITELPMWLAFQLEAKYLIKIKVPDWLSWNQLEDTINLEKVNESLFTKIPDGYIHIAHHFFRRPNFVNVHKEFPGELNGMKRSEQLFEELRAVREKKILKGLSTLDCDTQRLNINNMTPDEIEMWKVSFVESMNSFRKLKQDKKIASIGSTKSTTAGSETASRTAPSTSGVSKSRPQRQRRTSTTTSNPPEGAKRSSLFLNQNIGNPSTPSGTSDNNKTDSDLQGRGLHNLSLGSGSQLGESNEPSESAGSVQGKKTGPSKGTRSSISSAFGKKGPNTGSSGSRQ